MANELSAEIDFADFVLREFFASLLERRNVDEQAAETTIAFAIGVNFRGRN